MRTLKPGTIVPKSTRSATRRAGLPFLLAAVVSAAALVHPSAAVMAAVTRSASEGPVQLTATLDQDTAQVAQPVTLTITVDAPKDVTVTLPPNSKSLGDFTVIDTTDTSDIPTAKGRQWVRRYQLESLVPGKQTIPPVTIAYADHRGASPKLEQLQSPTMDVTVTSVLEGEPDPLKFRDVKGVVDLEVPSPQSNVWYVWSIGGAAALALAGVVALAWPDRRGRLSPSKWALQQLAALQRDDLLAAGKTELFYVRLTDIVRQYIERRFHIAASTQTTDEFLDQATRHSSLNDQQQGLLRVFLTFADLVKFAQLQPNPAEAQDAIDKARQFVQQSAATASSHNKNAPLAKENV